MKALTIKNRFQKTYGLLVEIFHEMQKGLDFMEPTKKVEKNKINTGKEWHFIPFAPETTAQIVEFIVSKSKIKKVADFGCGISTLLLMLSLTNRKYSLYGVEKQRGIFAAFKGLTEKINRTTKSDFYIKKGDITDLSPEYIKDKDLIYAYRPIKDMNEYGTLVDSYFDHMKPGAIFIDIYSGWGLAKYLKNRPDVSVMTSKQNFTYFVKNNK